MIRIAHLVNPVKVEQKSDLYLAQPITFASMETAKKMAKGKVLVELWSAQYSEDHEIIPDFFLKTADLSRSILDFKKFKIKRKLPLIKDILDLLFTHSQAEFFIYTNVDIALMPHFYLSVAQLIQQGFDALAINRRTIPAKFQSIEELPLMYAQAGEKHPGWDCFIFKREYYSHFNLGQGVIGQGWIGRIMLANLILTAKRFFLFEDLHLTFHLGDEKTWGHLDYADYKDHNMSQCRDILIDYEQRIGKLDRNQKPGEFLKLYESYQKNKKMY